MKFEREFMKQILAKPNTMTMHDNLTCQIYLMTKEEGGSDQPLAPFRILQMYSKGWYIPAQVFFKGKEMIMPGEDSSWVYPQY